MGRVIVLYVVALGIYDYLRGRKLAIVYTVKFNLTDVGEPWETLDRVAEHSDAWHS